LYNGTLKPSRVLQNACIAAQFEEVVDDGTAAAASISLTRDHAKEIVRYGGAEIHVSTVISSFLIITFPGLTRRVSKP
jgi:hypothetical protein